MMEPGEPRRRRLYRVFSWRFLATGITAALVYGFTRDSRLAAEVALLDTTLKAMTHYGHERVWARLHFGRTRPPEYSI